MGHLGRCGESRVVDDLLAAGTVCGDDHPVVTRQPRLDILVGQLDDVLPLPLGGIALHLLGDVGHGEPERGQDLNLGRLRGQGRGAAATTAVDDEGRCRPLGNSDGLLGRRDVRVVVGDHRVRLLLVPCGLTDGAGDVLPGAPGVVDDQDRRDVTQLLDLIGRRVATALGHDDEVRLVAGHLGDVDRLDLVELLHLLLLSRIRPLDEEAGIVTQAVGVRSRHGRGHHWSSHRQQRAGQGYGGGHDALGLRGKGEVAVVGLDGAGPSLGSRRRRAAGAGRASAAGASARGQAQRHDPGQGRSQEPPPSDDETRERIHRGPSRGWPHDQRRSATSFTIAL